MTTEKSNNKEAKVRAKRSKDNEVVRVKTERKEGEEVVRARGKKSNKAGIWSWKNNIKEGVKGMIKQASGKERISKRTPRRIDGKILSTRLTKVKLLGGWQRLAHSNSLDDGTSV